MTGWRYHLLVLTYWFASSCARRHSFSTRKDQRTLIGPLGFPFGFTETGRYNLTVYDFKVMAREYDKKGKQMKEDRIDTADGIGFLLKQFKDEGAFNNFLNDLEFNPKTCAAEKYLDRYYDDDLPIDDQYDGYDGFADVMDERDGIYLNMMSKSRWRPFTANRTYDFQIGEAGLYFLTFQICRQQESLDKDIRFLSQFELDFHFSNLDMFQDESYLSSGEMLLPHMFFYFSLFYATCLYLWFSNIQMIQKGGQGRFAARGEGRPVIFPIHHLMTALLLLKTCSVFFDSLRYHYIRITGHSEFYSTVFYIFTFMKGIFLFTVILLLGSGWSFLKPFLSDREKAMVCFILCLQVMNNIAIAALSRETSGERAFDRWTAVLHMVDILCCCAVLIPIVWQVNEMEQNLEKANGDNDDEVVDLQDDNILHESEFEEEERIPNNGRLAGKLKLFRSYYLLVIGYIYATRIVVYLFATMLNYKHTWMREFVVELVTLLFYVSVGAKFRPYSENVYSSLKSKQKVEIELTQ